MIHILWIYLVGVISLSFVCFIFPDKSKELEKIPTWFILAIIFSWPAAIFVGLYLWLDNRRKKYYNSFKNNGV